MSTLNIRLTEININSRSNFTCVPRFYFSKIIFFSSFDIHVNIIRFNRLRLSILHEMRILYVCVCAYSIYITYGWMKEEKNETTHSIFYRTEYQTAKQKSTKEKKIFVNLRKTKKKKSNSNTCFSIYTNYMIYSI